MPHQRLVFRAFATFWGAAALVQNGEQLGSVLHKALHAVMGLLPSTDPKGRELGEAARHCKKAGAE